MKFAVDWHSQRLGRTLKVVRWGHFGQPVLLFPTAGGDAEEIERFHVIGALQELIDGGRIKVFSCDSVAGRTWIEEEGDLRHRAHVQTAFHEFVAHELVPAIREDCRSPEMTVVAAGSSIGAFNAVAVTCRYPHLFKAALGLSGTYDLSRFLGGAPAPGDYFFSSPIDFVPGLSGKPLERLRERFILFATGQGRAENAGESWRMADVLGRAGIPNRVDAWGAEWHHDWPTWRRMFPQYLDELSRAPGGVAGGVVE